LSCRDSNIQILVSTLVPLMLIGGVAGAVGETVSSMLYSRIFSVSTQEYVVCVTRLYKNPCVPLDQKFVHINAAKRTAFHLCAPTNYAIMLEAATSNCDIFTP